MTVQATAQRCPADDPDAVDLYALGLPTTIVKDDLGEELMIGHGRMAVRLSIAAGTMLAGPVRLDYKLAGRRQLGRRLLALRQWEALMRLRRVPSPLVAPRVDSARAMIVIQTLNALTNHTNTRAVAIALFGADLVASDWDDESDYLRMKTRRLIGRARRLVAGDYVALLGRGH